MRNIFAVVDCEEWNRHQDFILIVLFVGGAVVLNESPLAEVILRQVKDFSRRDLLVVVCENRRVIWGVKNPDTEDIYTALRIRSMADKA